MMRTVLLLPSWLWLLLFVAGPFVVLAMIALATASEGVPPYEPGWSLVALRDAITDPLTWQAAWGSVRLAAIGTLLCLLLGYPAALAIARSEPSKRAGWLAWLMLPFWTSFLLRILAWIGILRDEGLLNGLLRGLGLISAPLHMLGTDGAAILGIVYCYLPFMILPLQARLAGADMILEQAAADLGASPWQIFLRVTLPLSLPGIAAGIALVLVPVAGEYVIPALMGSPGTLTIGRAIWESFFQERDWPLAASLAMLLLGTIALPALLLQRRR